MVSAATNSAARRVPASSSRSPSATATMTKPNSPPGPEQQRRPARAAQVSPNSRASRATISAFSTHQRRARRRASAPGCGEQRQVEAHADGDQEHARRSRPLNGSIVTSTWRRYSVPASSSPPISAPSAIDSPAAAVASAAAITTSRQAATNSSALRVRATLRNSGRSASRPSADDRRDREQRLADAPGRSRPAPRERAAGAERGDERTASAPRPGPGTAGWRSWRGRRGVSRRFSSASTWMHDRRSTTSPAPGRPPRRRPAVRPSSSAAPASAAAQTATCSAPRPNTSRRISHSRSKRQLQPDHEQQQDDAEIGDRRDRGGVADRDAPSQGLARRQRAEAERADDDADQHEAEHRAELAGGGTAE